MFSRLFGKETSHNLHRWANVNISCQEKMNKCMSYKWEDYAYKNVITTRFDEKNIGINKCQCKCGWKDIKKDPEGLEMLATMIF